MLKARTLRLADTPRRREPKRIRLNVSTINALRIERGRRELFVFDTETPHLAVMITAKGHKAFYWYGRRRNRPVRFKIGNVDELSIQQARHKAAQINADPDRDPNEAKRQLRGATLADIWTAFEEEHVKTKLRPRTQETYADLWRCSLKPWEKRPAAVLTDQDVRDMHRRITRSNGPVIANRALQMLRKMLTWARLDNPIRPGAIDWNDERPRDRHLSTEEMQRLLKAIEDMRIRQDKTRTDNRRDRERLDAADFIQIALFTGARRSNVLAMEWREIDIAAARWQIPSDKAKARIPIMLNLTPAVLEILNRRRKAHPSARYVFPGEGDAGHMVEPKRAWTSIRKAAEIPDVTLHDLRRTLASWMAQRGASLLEIGKALGHGSPDATKRYAHLAVASIAPHVNAAVDAMIAAGNATPRRSTKK